jgi:hypothetical protein
MTTEFREILSLPVCLYKAYRWIEQIIGRGLQSLLRLLRALTLINLISMNPVVILKGLIMNNNIGISSGNFERLQELCD